MKKKIKIIRNFSIENTVYRIGDKLVVDDSFGGSPRYYEVIGEIKTKPKKSRKRVPNRAVKSRNTAITNKDKS